MRSEVRSFGRTFSFFGFIVGSIGSGCLPPSAAVKAGGEADARARSVTATDVSVAVSRHQVLLESHTFGHQGETMITRAFLIPPIGVFCPCQLLYHDIKYTKVIDINLSEDLNTDPVAPERKFISVSNSYFVFGLSV